MEDNEMNEMEEKKKKVLSMCICADCPSYEECSKHGGEDELGFCFPTIGKSHCITDEKGCICGGCPVYKEMNMKAGYYCTRGSEKEQSGM